MGLGTATALVIASMVGTGVFTTTGLLVELLPSAPAAIACWAVGGVMALCGALSYAELGAAMPENGGEYHFLSRLFHPCVGFLSAWVSLIVGFGAPLAAVALAFGQYAAVFAPGLSPRVAGGTLILVLSLVNAWRVTTSAGLQNVLTYGKVLLIVGFIVLGGWLGSLDRLVAPVAAPLLPTVTSSGFAVGLLLVSFSYFGWNAAAYVAGEVRDPGRVMPRSLALGTAVVMVLYVLLNAVFFAAAPLSALAGKVEVGHVAAVALLGSGGGKALSAVVTLGLLSTVGALIVTGPRVYEAVGAEVPRLSWLAARSGRGGPGRAIALQSSLALVMLATAGFEALLTYIGFTLSIFSGLTVLGVFVLRRRTGGAVPFRTPGYPVTPLVFVALMAWMVVHAVVRTPGTAAAGAVTVVVGLGVYVASTRRAAGRRRRDGG
jgi:APA family basic amino acid/polyamine antiporter